MQAVGLGREALDQVEKTESIFEQENALHSLAEAQYAAGDVSGAIAHLERAAAIRRTTSRAIAAAHHGALLAGFYAQAGDCATALAHAQEVPTDEPKRSVGLLWPQRSAWCTAFAYHAGGRDDKASAWLARAIALYEAHLPYLNQERQTRFSALPWHRAMFAAAARDWPAAVWLEGA